MILPYSAALPKIFTGEVAVSKIRACRKAERMALANGTRPWDIWSTPLQLYAEATVVDGYIRPRPNFLNYLMAKVREARENGGQIKVLDIGIGSGSQWLPALKGNNDAIELHGTSLIRGNVRPEIRDRVKLCTAGRLDRHFSLNYFDIAVSHYGTHMQEQEAVEGIHRVLKVGGEAMVCGSDFRFPELFAGRRGQFIELGKDLDKKTGQWFYHIRKADG